jgi:hypothetical protein
VADLDNLTTAPKHCDANEIDNGQAKAVVGYASYTRGNEKYVPAIIDVVIHESDRWLLVPFFSFIPTSWVALNSLLVSVSLCSVLALPMSGLNCTKDGSAALRFV